MFGPEMVYEEGTEAKLQGTALKFLKNNSSYRKKQNQLGSPTETGRLGGMWGMVTIWSPPGGMWQHWGKAQGKTKELFWLRVMLKAVMFTKIHRKLYKVLIEIFSLCNPWTNSEKQCILHIFLGWQLKIFTLNLNSCKQCFNNFWLSVHNDSLK